MIGFKKHRILGVSILAIVLVCLVLFYLYSKKDSFQYISASSASASVSSQAEWQEGTTTNIDSASSPGSIKISDETNGELTSGTWTTTGTGDAASLHDDDTSTGVHLEWGSGQYVQFEYNTEIYIHHIRFYNPLQTRTRCEYWTGEAWVVFLAGDAPMGGGVYPGWTPDIGVLQTTSKIKCSADTSEGPGGGQPDVDDNEFEVYTTGLATHTTGATQIDGGENFWEWEAITPAQATPANTSITYRYRSSADGATWNDWHSAIGDVEDRSGDDLTKYRYLQVEATLSNTDGVSTPTIDSYDIDYHTEVKPDTPSASTAVVQ